MAISTSSKILASDVSGKIDTAGTGLIKSGTTLSLASLHSASSTIGSSSVQTLAYSGTFTIPYVSYDEYGRVSGGGERTITMPSAPTVTNISGTAAKATTIPNVSVASTNSSIISWTLPSGGTWKYYAYRNKSNVGPYSNTGTVSGGTKIDRVYGGIAIRTA